MVNESTTNFDKMKEVPLISTKQIQLRSPQKSFKQRRLKPQYGLNNDLEDSFWQYSGCTANNQENMEFFGV